MEENIIAEIFALVQVNPELAAIIVLVCLGVGKLAKETPAIKNHYIGWATAVIGIALGVALISRDVKGAALGFILAVFATGLHSWFKNGVLRKTSNSRPYSA